MARHVEKEKERDVTVLGKTTRFQGTLSFTEEVQIAGKFDGTIDAQGSLVVRKGAICNADRVKAASIIVEGSITGDLHAGDRIEMRCGSFVRGNIVASRLKIADEVTFEGKVEMIRPNVEIDFFATRPDVLKDEIRLRTP